MTITQTELQPPSRPPLVGCDLAEEDRDRVAARLVASIIGEVERRLMAFSSFNGSWRQAGVIRR